MRNTRFTDWSLKKLEMSISGKFLPVIYTSLTFLLPLIASAQPGMPDAPVPLDGGLITLLAAGAAYGVKKYRDNNNQET